MTYELGDEATFNGKVVGTWPHTGILYGTLDGTPNGAYFSKDLAEKTTWPYPSMFSEFKKGELKVKYKAELVQHPKKPDEMIWLVREFLTE